MEDTDLKPWLDIGDPLADRVITETAGLRGSGALIDNALHNGPGESSPEPIVALIDHAGRYATPDNARLARGSDAYLSIGAPWIAMSLGPGSLTHTYSSGSISRVLMRTGNLTRVARQRIAETATWNIATVLPNGLSRGQPGWVHNLQVRLLHARVRHALLAKGWDRRAQGMPINQVELVRTWLDFTYVPFNALEAFGITFTETEIRDLYALWRAAAHILGIDERLYGSVTDQRTGAALLARVDAITEPPGEESRALTLAMIEAMGELLAPRMNLPAFVTRALAATALRRLHGREVADALGVRANWSGAIFPAFVAANRRRRQRERHNPTLRSARISETAHRLAAALDLDTTYKRALGDNDVTMLPETVADG